MDDLEGLDFNITIDGDKKPSLEPKQSLDEVRDGWGATETE